MVQDHGGRCTRARGVAARGESAMSMVVYATLMATYAQQPTQQDRDQADLALVLQLCTRIARSALRKGGAGWGPDDADFVALAALDKVGRRVARTPVGQSFCTPAATLSYVAQAIRNLVHDDRLRHRCAINRLLADPSSMDWAADAHHRRCARMLGMVEAGGHVADVEQQSLDIDALTARARQWLLDELVPSLVAQRGSLAGRMAVFSAFAQARSGGLPGWQHRFAVAYGQPWSPALRAQMQRARSEIVAQLDAICQAESATCWVDAAELSDPVVVCTLFAAALQARQQRRGRNPTAEASMLRLGCAAVARLWVHDMLCERRRTH